MKNYTKIALAGLLVTSLFVLTACDSPWLRLKKASTIALVGMNASPSLSEFGENGDPQGGTDGNNVGISEATSIFGGFLKGNAAGAAQEVAGKRDENLRQTQKSAAEFQDEIVPLIKGSLQKGRFVVKDYDLLGNVNLTDEKLAKGLVKEAGTDAIVECSNTLGYVKKDKNFGLSKEYRLAVRTVATFADKDGLIGTKVYFAMSGQRRDSESTVPAFTKEDFDSVKNQLLTQIRTDLISIKVAE